MFILLHLHRYGRFMTRLFNFHTFPTVYLSMYSHTQTRYILKSKTQWKMLTTAVKSYIWCLSFDYLFYLIKMNVIRSHLIWLCIQNFAVNSATIATKRKMVKKDKRHNQNKCVWKMHAAINVTLRLKRVDRPLSIRNNNLLSHITNTSLKSDRHH